MSDFLIDQEMVESYWNACSQFGPDSKECKGVREKYKDNRKFINFADSIDRIYKKIHQEKHQP